MTVDTIQDSDASENEEQYSSLYNAVTQLDSVRRVKAPTRKELSDVVSEYHLPKTRGKNRTAIRVRDLVNVLQQKTDHDKLGAKVMSITRKGRTLPRPLDKPVADRIKRSLGYGNVKTQLKKWNAVVEKNRVADNLTFPLNQGRITLQSSKNFLSKFKTETPLEKEMFKILNPGKEEKENEEKDKEEKNLDFPLTLEEIMEKRKEMAQLRAKLSYREARAHRQSRIKSKKYHRILKREKIKQQLKEFEQLQKSDPEAALKKLEQLDKSRAEERASLRHKNTGKWAKNHAVRAKYNTESRKILAEQLKLSRSLTEKVKNTADGEDDSSDEEKETGQGDVFVSDDNPWAVKVSSEVSSFFSGYKKYWENKNKEEASKKAGKDVKAEGSAATATETPVKTVNDAETKTENNLVNGDSPAKHSNEDVVGRPTSAADAPPESKDINRSVKKKTLKGENKKKSRKDEMPGSVSKGKRKVDVPSSRNSNESAEGDKVSRTSPGKGLEKKSKKKSKSVTVVNSASGSWTVKPVDEDKPTAEKKRKTSLSVDELFDDLEERLASKASQKLARVSAKVGNKRKRKRPKPRVKKVESDDDKDVDMSMPRNPSTMKPSVDEELLETPSQDAAAAALPVRTADPEAQPQVETQTPVPPQIDPKKFIEVKAKKLSATLPDGAVGEIEDDAMDDDDDDEKTQRMNIIEAFNDDDVVDEFREMKNEEEKTTRIEVADVLPGWGSWAGSDIRPNRRKRRKVILNIPKLPARKDHDKPDTIINENANPKIVDHMVKEVPFPFSSVGSFEANIRNPVGREWVPESAHRNFTVKPVETRLGAIITPMDESELARLNRNSKPVYRGKRKNSGR